MKAVKDPRHNRSTLYDFYPWTQQHPAGLDPVALQKLAQSYGASNRFDDILDLGCGTGELLIEAGVKSKGAARWCRRLWQIL